MTHATDGVGVAYRFVLAGMAVLMAACSLEYHASVPPVEDEVVVQAGGIDAALANHDEEN